MGFSRAHKESKSNEVQEEVRRVMGNKSKVEEDDVRQMRYLECVVKETLRLHPPVPLLVPRVTRSSVTLGGYYIPPKTTVFVNAFATQRDPEFWERPEECVPERFEGNQLISKAKTLNLFLLALEGGVAQEFHLEWHHLSMCWLIFCIGSIGSFHMKLVNLPKT